MTAENPHGEPIPLAKSLEDWKPGQPTRLPHDPQEREALYQQQDEDADAREIQEIQDRGETAEVDEVDDRTHNDLRQLDDIAIDRRAAENQRPHPDDAGHVPPQQ